MYCYKIVIAMQMTISVTNKWQVHIPKAARKVLKLTKPGRMEIKTEQNKLVLIPVESKILQMAGKYEKYTRSKKVNLDRIRDYIDYSKA